MKAHLTALAIALLVVAHSGCGSGSDVAGPEDTFNITGTWLIRTNDGRGPVSYFYSFSGSPTQGTVTIQGINSTGTYTVSGNSIQFVVSYGATSPLYEENYDGVVVDANAMGGAFTITLDESPSGAGTWEGGR